MQDDTKETQLTYIFANMSDAVCITRKNGGVLYMNNSAEKLFGVKEYTGLKIWDVIRFTEKNDNLIQMFLDAVTQGRDISSLVEYEASDGKILHLHISMTYMYKTSGVFVMVARDLTELVRVKSAFERYTSPEIANYVLNTPDGEKQGGTLRDVSILMSDLRGFTALSSKLQPDRLITFLNHYFEAMTEIIGRYNGTVIEFLGDGMFVVFGAPDDDEKHPEHAVYCAVEMQNAMKAVNEWNAANGYPELEMGIGVNSGYAVVGNIGSAQKMKYGCMGETVNIAYRIEALTTGGQIYICERTRARISDALRIAGEQSFMPKGEAARIKVYAVEGIGGIHMRHAEYEMREIVSRPVVKYYMISENKSIEGKRHTARVVKVSSDERYAVIESDEALAAMQNMMIDIDGELYAKVIEVRGKEITICFTSKPEGFRDWVKGLE